MTSYFMLGCKDYVFPSEVFVLERGQASFSRIPYYGFYY
jgi:hypothetical protein